VATVVRMRGVGLTADFCNAREAWLTSSRTKMKMISDVFPYIYFLPFL